MMKRFFTNIWYARTIIHEMWWSRKRVYELEDELQALKAVMQRLVEEVRKLKQELEELRAWTQAEHEKIRLRLERIEQGLPAGTESDKDNDWIM
jgi:cell division protein FtsB